MKNFKKSFALVLSIMMIFGIMTSLFTTGVFAVESTDIDEAINFLMTLEIMQGDENGSDRRDESVTREEASSFFARINTGFTDKTFWKERINNTPFTDILDSEYIGEISAAYDMGIINGATTVEGIKIFNPNGKVTYQDMLVMAVRALGYDKLDNGDDKNLYYPWGYIAEAVKLNLTENMDGVPYETELTRGQVAIVLHNVLNTVVNGSEKTLIDKVFGIN